MKFTGKFVGGVRIDLDTQKLELTVQSDKDSIGPEWEELRKCEKLTFEVKKYRKGRSLDANAYYWQLLTKLADKLDMSKPHMHNFLLRRYGQPEIVDGKLIHVVVPDSDGGTRIADEAETFHIRPTAQVKEFPDGKMYRTYVMLRGSSTYDTREMSKLIDGLVTECKEQGIDTLPPAEFERMMAVYDQNWRKRHEEAV